MRVSILMVLIAVSCSISYGESLISNGNFQAGTLAGWSAGVTPATGVPGGSPYFPDPSGWRVAATDQTYIGGLPAISGFSAYSGFDGGQVNSSGQPLYEAPLDYYLRQAFTIAAPEAGATLSFQYQINGGPYAAYSSRGTAVLPRTFSAEILASDLTVIGTPYSFTDPVEVSHPTDEFGQQDVNVDVATLFSSLNPGTYYLQFHEHIPQYYTGAAGLVLDNISLDATAAPLPSAVWGGFALLGILGIWRFRRAGLVRKRG